MPDPVERQALPDRGARPEFLTGDNVWLAIGPCGCGYAIDTCDDRDAQANVAGWRAEGSTVVQVPIEEARGRLVLDCPHEPRYGLLPVSEARAEAIRLRPENKALPSGSPLGSLHEDKAEIRRLRAENEALQENLARMQEAGDRLTAENARLIVENSRLAALASDRDDYLHEIGEVIKRYEDLVYSAPASDEGQAP